MPFDRQELLDVIRRDYVWRHDEDLKGYPTWVLFNIAIQVAMTHMRRG